MYDQAESKIPAYDTASLKYIDIHLENGLLYEHTREDGNVNSIMNVSVCVCIVCNVLFY